MRVTCPRCTEEWTGTTAAHCPTCHQTFSTNGVADKAHAGPFNAGPRCVDPASVGLVKNARGYWSTPSDGKWLESITGQREAATEVSRGPGHVILIERGSTEWQCTCGYERTGFEDYDAADAAADEHLHDAQATA